MGGKKLIIQEKMNEVLKCERERSLDLLYQMDDWVWGMNNKGEFTYSNLKVKELLGYSPSDLVGKPVSQFIIETKDNDTRSYIHRDGHDVQLISTKIPIINSAGTCIGFLGRDRQFISE